MFGPTLFEIAFGDAAFRLTLAVVVVLFLLAFGFVIVAVILRVARHVRQRQARRRCERWRPMLVDVLANRRPPNELRTTVRSGEARAFLEFLIEQLSAVETQAKRELIRAVAAPFLPGVEVRIDAGAPEVRAQRVKVLGRLGGDSYEKVLLRALDDDSPLVAIVALQFLVARGAAHAADAIIERLRHFHSVSPQALATLLSTLGPAIAPALRAVFVNDHEALRTRLIAAASLQRLADPEAADLAAAMLERGGPRDLMTASLRLLGQTEGSRHLPLLRRLARSDDEVIRVRALSTLTRIGAADVAGLREALNDSSRWVAIQGARGLVEADRPDVLDELAGSGHSRAALARQILSERCIAV